MQGTESMRTPTRRAASSGGNMMKTRPTVRTSARAVPILLAVGLAVGSMAVTGASASASAPSKPTLQAFGSAQQVYVTGLAPSTPITLVDGSGHVIAHRSTNALGAALFRNVAPGSGYHVRRPSHGAHSAALTVHTNRSAPWDPQIYNQTIAGSGYQYLTTRDGTQLNLTRKLI